MGDKEQAIRSFVAKVEADEELRAKVEAALVAGDAKAVATLVAEQGLELEESDIQVAVEGDREDADGKNELSIDGLEGVTGGMEIVTVKNPELISPILRMIFKIKREEPAT